MSAPLPTYPQYGQGGDYAGQRRLRRSFRYGVLAIMAFAGALFYYEGYKKLGLHETQYRRALTLDPASARPILRRIIADEVKSGALPTALYVEALAGVEEPDRLIPTYQDAARLSPRDSALLIKQGCELFLRQMYAEAREAFREAGAHPPRNALPNYLEAAALAANLPAGGDLSEAMALMARANNSNASVLFPAPLWHNTLPQKGEYYANHRRELATRVCAPLSAFKQQLAERAQRDIEANAPGDWVLWLEKLELMGRRIATGRDENDLAESTHVVAGINIQLEALKLRKLLLEKQGGNTATLEEPIAKLSSAMDLFSAYEDERTAEIERSRAVVKRPFVLLLGTLLCSTAAYLLVWLYGVVFRAQPWAVALSHSRLGIGALLGGTLFLAAALALLGVAGGDPAVAKGLEYTWCVVLLGLLLFGSAYPSLTLPSPSAVIQAAGDTRPEAIAAARAARRSAGVALARRYFGALNGGAFAVLALWLLVFRLAHGVYPQQFALLVSGAEELGATTIARALALLP